MKSRLWIFSVCAGLLLLSITVEAMHLRRADSVLQLNIKAAAEHVGSKCPKCQGSMEQGVILEGRGQGIAEEPTNWVPGTVQRRHFFAGIDAKEKHPVFAFRCTNCGYVELFAK